MSTTISFPRVSNEIRRIRTAVFKDGSNALLKFSSGLITIDEVDDNGNIWFQASQVYSDTSGFQETFPVQLEFYKKEENCQVVVEGVGSIAKVYAGHKALIRCRVTLYSLSRFKKISTPSFFIYAKGLRSGMLNGYQYKGWHKLTSLINSII